LKPTKLCGALRLRADLQRIRYRLLWECRFGIQQERPICNGLGIDYDGPIGLNFRKSVDLDTQDGACIDTSSGGIFLDVAFGGGPLNLAADIISQYAATPAQFLANRSEVGAMAVGCRVGTTGGSAVDDLAVGSVDFSNTGMTADCGFQVVSIKQSGTTVYFEVSTSLGSNSAFEIGGTLASAVNIGTAIGYEVWVPWSVSLTDGRSANSRDLSSSGDSVYSDRLFRLRRQLHESPGGADRPGSLYSQLLYDGVTGTPTSFGTATFSAGSQTASFSCSSHTFSAGNYLKMVGPSTADSTLQIQWSSLWRSLRSSCGSVLPFCPQRCALGRRLRSGPRPSD
jgi:hypothetical protein